jgi:PDZ domain-containing protein
MNRRATTLVAAAALVVGLVIAAFFLPVPYVVLVPGPVTDTLGRVPAADTANNQPGGEVIQITGVKVQPSTGHLYLTTVGIEPGSCSQDPALQTVIKAWFERTKTVEPKQVECPPGVSSSAVQDQGEQEMTSSQSNAVYAALTELGYKSTGNRVVVESVSSGVPAAKVLHPADVIESVNSTPISSPGQLVGAVTRVHPGSSIELSVQHAGSTRTLDIATTKAPNGKARLGVVVGTTPTFSGISVTIGIDPDVIGGPSAGTALALGIIDKLTPGGLTGGRTIAGTGTVNRKGTVGPIGGIQQKIAAAVRAGATVFFAPSSECSDAKAAAPSSLTLIRVKTLHGAVQALTAIKNGSTVFPHC